MLFRSPSAVGLFERGNRTGSAIGLGIGVLLLLASQGFIHWDMFAKLIVAVIFVIIGLKLIFDEGRRHKTVDFQDNMNNADNTYTYTYDSNNTTNNTTNNSSDYTNNSNGNYYNNDKNANFNSGSNGASYNEDRDSNIVAIFSGKNLNYNARYFGGVAVTAIFGGIELDLRNAVIDKDVIIDVTAIFGGIDIFVPGNVRVVTNCTPILGGVDNKTVNPSMVNGMNMPTIYVNGACIFGGVDIK